MVLKSLKLTNWRTHRDLTVSFTPGVNAIVGPNDSGKTNILRALRFLLLNDGGKFSDVVSPGEKETRVEAEWDTGLVITRVRRSKVNRYIIRDPGAEEMVLDKVGNDPVPEVYERTRVYPAGSEGLELSWQGVGYPSPLDMSPKALAGVLGRLSGAESVERSVSFSAARFRDIGSRLKQAEETKDRAMATRDRLAGAADLPPLVQAVDDAETLWNGAVARETQLVGLQTRLSAIPPLVDPTLLAQAEQATVAAEAAGTAYVGAVSQETSLTRLLGSIPAECDTTCLDQPLIAAEAAGEVYRQWETTVATLNGFQARLRAASDALDLSARTAAVEQKNFADALGAHEVCPLCGSHLEGVPCPSH